MLSLSIFLTARGGYNGGNGVIPPSAAENVIAAMSPAPNAARATRIITLVTTLQIEDVWDDVDILYIEAAHSEQAAKLNWKATASFALTEVGTVTFQVDEGLTGDDTTGILDTGWIPNTHGVNFTLNDASYGAWSLTNAVNADVIMGCRTSAAVGQTFMNTRGAGDLATMRINQDVAGASMSNADSSGFFIAQRTANNAVELFRNDVSLGTKADASTSLPTVALYLLGINTGGSAGSFSAFQTSVHFAGKSLTAGKRTAFYNALIAYFLNLADDYPVVNGDFFANRYFAPRYFANRYFG